MTKETSVHRAEALALEVRRLQVTVSLMVMTTCFGALLLTVCLYLAGTRFGGVVDPSVSGYSEWARALSGPLLEQMGGATAALSLLGVAMALFIALAVFERDRAVSLAASARTVVGVQVGLALSTSSAVLGWWCAGAAMLLEQAGTAAVAALAALFSAAIAGLAPVTRDAREVYLWSLGRQHGRLRSAGGGSGDSKPPVESVKIAGYAARSVALSAFVVLTQIWLSDGDVTWGSAAALLFLVWLFSTMSTELYAMRRAAEIRHERFSVTAGFSVMTDGLLLALLLVVCIVVGGVTGGLFFATVLLDCFVLRRWAARVRIEHAVQMETWIVARAIASQRDRRTIETT